MPDRRQFLIRAASAAVLLPSFSTLAGLADFQENDSLQYIPFSPEQDALTRLPLPEGKRVPFGMDYFSLDVSGDGLVLNVADLPEGRISLRLHVGIDTREKDEVEVTLARSGRKIGHLSVWYATSLQLFETQLDADPATICREGIRLKMTEGKNPLFLLGYTPQNGSHLLVQDGRENKSNKRWLDTLCSLRSVQPFGWLEGCVLDGLNELYVRKKDKRALNALRQHLDLFLKPDGSLIYEDPLAKPSDNRFDNLEAGLPYAVIVKHDPKHPSVSLFIDYCQRRIDASGRVKDNFLSTEGCYTVAYPLATIAKELNKPAFFGLALIELEERIKNLTDQDAVYTRGWKNEGKKTYRNWGRGYTWFLLGLVRTAEILQNDSPFKNDARIKRLKEVYIHYAELALRFRQPDHSWRAYLDLPETSYDSSATAGIGAALAHGKRIGWLNQVTDDDLNKIRLRLINQLTPDGFLTGICQQNAAGEELQKSSYRVIAQYVPGLMGHIEAHLK
ncbi:MAG: glycoside hydrolase family 88 protein [Prolixibacteraceae bacterium]